MINSLTLTIKKQIDFIQIIILIIFSVILFYYWQGFLILNTSHTRWLLSGDLFQNYASTLFFRYSSYNFPLGDISNVDFPVGSNIIFSDGNIFLSLIIKLLSDFLPKNFQLYGWWLLICLVLQFISAWWILKQTEVNGVVRILGAIIIGLYPAFFVRASHLNLMPHFILLFSIGIYFSKYYSLIKKIIILNILLLFSEMVHFYFAPIVWGVIQIILIEGYFSKSLRIKYFFVLELGSLSLLIITMYFLGYFSGFESSDVGFGFYSMNINAPFNHMRFTGASILPPFLVGTEGQYEGYQYFGLGIILLLISLILSLFFRKTLYSNFKSFFSKSLIYFIIILTVISLSNKWYLGQELIFEFDLPLIFMKIISPFRASGRYFWFVGYLLITITIILLYRCYSYKSALIILLSIIIQFYDTNLYIKNQTHSNNLITHYPKEEFIKISNLLKKHDLYKKPIYIEGSEENKKIIITHLAHLNVKNIFSIGPWPTVRKSLRFENIGEKKYLDYVIHKKGIYISNKSSIPPDGFNEIIFKGKSLNIFQYNTQMSLNYNGINFNIDTITIDKSNSFKSKNIIYRGWASAEPTIRWSLGDSSKLYFKIGDLNNLQGILNIHIGTLEQQTIKISINNHYIGSKTLESTDKIIQLNFMPNYLKPNTLNFIQLEYSNAHQPSDHDSRILAVALKDFEIK
ncbi:MAG: hypothetical protein KAU26_05165 [Methylococcales bacterium]|nr:hypothetical protein [Methylococcales bacterium]